MTAPFDSSDLARFRAAVASHLGLQFEDARSNELAAVFERLCVASDGGAAAYLARLERARLRRRDLHALARQLTVGETYFFRNPDQLRAFAEAVLPERRAARASQAHHASQMSGPCVRILSAGCASGEEAYSLAIIARECGAPRGEVTITGVDVNAAALERAAEGRYSAWSLRETPADVRRRWFREVGRDYAVAPSIRAEVRFEERNLAAPEPDLWLSESYDVIFCRNVLMYLTPETVRAVVARMKQALAPGGYLFLGHADSLRELSQEFSLRNTHGTFYYQRTTAEACGPAGSIAPPRPSSRPPGGEWAETVRRSTERIRELSEQPAVRPSCPGPEPGSGSPLAESMALLARERFAGALECLDRLPEHEASAPDVLLVRAILLTHQGQLEAAERACSKLRAGGADSAGAHYLLALCREGVGDRTGALENDRVAAALDPGFAMPRLHLGLLARRSGDLRAAQRELGQALDLLAGEDAERIRLFGGGFTREALTRLCRAELRAAGGAR